MTINTATAINTIANLKDNTFAQSLVKQYRTKGVLSAKQLYWVEKLADEALNPTTATSVSCETDMSGIVALMQKASGKLKYPKIRIATVSGKPIALGVAGPRSKNPGAINITDGGRYGENTWYGKITTAGVFEPSRVNDTEVREFLITMSENPTQVAADYGHKTGNCCFCSRGLTDERSTMVGYGPVCADNYDLVWG